MTLSFSRYFVLWVAGLYFLAFMGCQPSDAPDTAPLPTSTFVLPDTLRPVALPNLDDYPPAVRTQLENHLTRLQALQHDPASAERGEAAGRLGSLLLTYDLTDAAEPALLNALYLRPEDYRWPYYLGRLYQSTNQLEQAVPFYERTLVLQPDDVPTHIHLAEVYREMGRNAEAKPLLERALRLDPNTAAAHFLLGQIADENDDPAQAITHYQGVLRLQPDATMAHYPLGLAYRQQGDEQRSQTYLARRGEGPVQLEDPLVREIEQQRKGAGAKINQGGRFMEQGKFREAAIAFSEAIAEDSTEISGYLNLGAAFMQLGEWQRARPVLEQALRIDPTDSKVNYNLGLILAQQQNPEAKVYFRTAVEQDAENFKAHLGLARMLWREGQCAAALPHFEAFLTATPDAIEIRINTAMCHAQVENYAAARDLLEAGYAAHPTHPGLQDALVRILSASEDAAVRDGARALGIAQSLVATMRRPETLSSLAMALAETGRYPEAIQRQQEALRMARQGGGQSNFVPFLQQELRRYEQSLPSRTPWPGFMFPQPPA
ncbi:MAG TPA: tetratricopeptide repeat protein [Rhodothermales bacterium]|nr:tetratricopeptide repeat protein [Rhodothermales bacterium]